MSRRALTEDEKRAIGTTSPERIGPVVDAVEDAMYRRRDDQVAPSLRIALTLLNELDPVLDLLERLSDGLEVKLDPDAAQSRTVEITQLRRDVLLARDLLRAHGWIT